MKSERLKRLTELYHAALELEKSQRAAFLEEECAGDEDLRHEVESALAKDTEVEGFAEKPTAGLADGARITNADPWPPHPAGGGSSENPRLKPGTTLSHYRLIGKLGAGGMGVVYKAEDIKLLRHVALKFLPSSLAADPVALARFQREARAASALNHPNICTIYEIEEADGQMFLAMELLDGTTLLDMLAKAKLAPDMDSRSGSKVPFDRLLELSVQIADALDVAHAQGIIHCDIKPANIFVTRRGQAKILDFGIAKLAGPAAHKALTESQDAETGTLDLAQFTKAGAVMGTVGYMSPEQARGGEVDQRSDIFSFGVMLYEFLVACFPAQKGVVASGEPGIPKEVVRWLGSVAPEVSPEIDRIVMRCLQMDPALRFQQMKEVKAALQEMRLGATRTTAEAIPSIAVLPFANLSADPENEYFSDGLTEELINALARVPGLRVLARNSTFLLKHKRMDLREIGQKLGVQTVLDGSVRKAGNRIRITAQLADAMEGSSLWSERFDRNLQDIFAVQDEVVRSILTNLKPKFATTSRYSGLKPNTENFEAHELYLRGRYSYCQQTPEALAKALAYFEQAAAIAPEHALTQVGLADCHLLRGWYELSPASEVIPKAKKAAERALEIDDTLATAHCALALVQGGYEWCWPEAEARFLRALELGPGLAAIHFHYGLDYLTPMGRLDDAIQEIHQAQELDPLSLINRTALGGCFYRNRQYDDAIREFEKSLEIEAGFYHAHWSLARALEEKGLFDEAVEEFRRAIELSAGKNAMIWAELGHCYGLMSQTTEVRKILEEIGKMARRTYVSPLCFAFVHLGFGSKDEVFDCLDEAVEQRSRLLIWIGVDPRFDSLRSEARFARLTTLLGLPKS